MHVYFGDTDVGAAAKNVKISSHVNELATARIVLDPQDQTLQGIDFWSEVRVTAVQEGAEHPLFTGSVVRATEEDSELVVECQSGVALAEQLMPALAALNVDGAELIYTAARLSGIQEERLHIDGLDALPTEPFEVVVPVDGVVTASPVVIGHVKFASDSYRETLLTGSEAGENLTEPFLNSTAYAVAYEPGQRMLDVEEAGLLQIDIALSYLIARGRYARPRLPGGQTSAFNRDTARTAPSRGRVVLVLGLHSKRRWLRVLVGGTAVSARRSLDEPATTLPPLPPDLSLQNRQALLALRRGVTEDDPLGRVSAIWDAIEFYVAGTTVPPLFTKAELKAVRGGFPAGLGPEKTARLTGLLGQLNSPPLMTRLTTAISTDGVGLTDGELELLRRLRGLRNDAVHGRSVDVPTGDELDHAVGLVSRMLVTRLHQLSLTPGGTTST